MPFASTVKGLSQSLGIEGATGFGGAGAGAGGSTFGLGAGVGGGAGIALVAAERAAPRLIAGSWSAEADGAGVAVTSDW